MTNTNNKTYFTFGTSTNRLKKTLFFRKFIHTTLVRNSSRVFEEAMSRVSNNESLNRNSDLEELVRLSNERISSLQLIKFYNKEVDEDSIEFENNTSIADSFSWLIDENGKNIEFNNPIKLFDGIRLISLFLEKRYEMDQNLLSKVKLTELLEGFVNGDKDITVIELFNHVGQIINKDANRFKISVDELSSYSKDINTDINDNVLNLSAERPFFGKYGDITLNEIGAKFQNLNWDIVLNNTQLKVNTIPVAMNFIGFNLILRSYIKHVHNRPYEPNLDIKSRRLQEIGRNRSLFVFLILGAPLVLFSLKHTAISLKNLGSIDFSLGTSVEPRVAGLQMTELSPTDNNNIIKNSFFLLINNLKNKIPKWVKLSFIVIGLILFVLKLIGLNFIEFIGSSYYLKIYIYIMGSLAIFYQILNLYLLHLFINKKIQISEVLPNFLINWLKEFEVICSNKENVKVFKDMYYRDILVYILIIIFVTLIF